MGIGVGIVLLVIGLILVTGAVNIPDNSYVETGTVGWILVLAGILGIVLGLIAMRSRSHTRVVEERRDV